MNTVDKSIQTGFVFENFEEIVNIYGVNNANIVVMEQLLGTPIYPIGNQLRYITNSPESAESFKHLCKILLDSSRQGITIDANFIQTAYSQLTGEHINPTTTEIDDTTEFPHKSIQADDIKSISIPITATQVVSRTPGQHAILHSLENSILSFLVGPAGTGKTYLATAYALSQLLSKKKQKYVITRPVVESGERLGFLPGDLEQKILPYLRPIYDVLYELVGESIVKHLQEHHQLEIAPLAYMRGRTIKNAIVLLDEAQNCTPVQMRMFLTRLGEGSMGIVNGDLTQSDLSMSNGLKEAVKVFTNIPHVNIVRLTDRDIQRSKLARIVIAAYNKNDTY